MKKLFLLPFLALMASAPVSAGQILPYLYADEYCSMREMGVNVEEARNAAVSVAYVASMPNLPEVTVDGATATVDVLRAVRATSDRCPQYL